jgi:hypothetical protein
MPVNNIAFAPFQADSGADTFLGSYAKSQQIAQAREAAERQKVLAQRQDQAYTEDKRMKAIDTLGAMLDGVQDEGSFEQVKGWAVQNGLLDPNEAQRYTFQQLPQIRALSQQARQIAAQRAKAQQEQQEFGLKSRLTEAQIGSERAQANAANANAQRILSGPQGNVDPNTGVRIPPAGVQGKDVTQLQKYEQTADAFSSIATVLRNAQGAFDRVQTGPGTGLARAAAAPFAMLGVESANQFVADYDAIDAAAKEGGIEKLKGIGGSDTERELLTAIQTGVNVETPTPENKRRIGNAIAAAEIASQRHRLATEWVNKFGALSYAAGNGMTWPQFWSTYQKQAWADHLKGRGGAGGGGGGGAAPASRGNSPAPPPGFEVIQ